MPYKNKPRPYKKEYDQVQCVKEMVKTYTIPNLFLRGAQINVATLRRSLKVLIVLLLVTAISQLREAANEVR